MDKCICDTNFKKKRLFKILRKFKVAKREVLQNFYILANA